jgi:hypothetical protein
MKFELGTLKRYAGALVFGAALLVGAGATANAQHGSYNGGHRDNGYGGHARRESRHERRDDVRAFSHRQRDSRNYNEGRYNRHGGRYGDSGWGGGRRDRHRW